MIPVCDFFRKFRKFFRYGKADFPGWSFRFCGNMFFNTNKLSVILLILCSSVFLPELSAQQTAGKRKVKLAPLYIDLGETKQAKEESKPEKVIIDRSNVVILEKAPPKKTDRKRLSKTVLHKMARWTVAPANSLAKRLAPAVKNISIHWKPFRGSMYLSGTSLLDAKLSPDKSIIVFLESTGKTSGPKGTRIILYDTHQWQILRVEDLEECYAISCAWAENGLLALLCRGQKKAHTDHALYFYDTVSGKLLPEHKLNFEPGKTFLSDEKNNFLVTEKNKENVHFFRYDESKGELKKIKTYEDFSPGILLVNALSGKAFHVCDRKNIYSFRYSDGKQLGKTKLPPLDNSFFLQAILPLPGNAFLLVPSPSSGTAVRYFRGSSLLGIGTASSGLALQGFQDSTFAAGFSRGGEFGIYELPSLNRTFLFSACNTKPKTRGTPLFAFAIPHAKAFAVMDTGGDFYLLYPDRAGKRYLKELLTVFIR